VTEIKKYNIDRSLTWMWNPGNKFVH